MLSVVSAKQGAGFLVGRLSLALLAAVLAAAFLARAAAQETASGRLESVAVNGSKKFRSEQIAPVTGLKKGDQVTRDDLQKGANALAACGLFSEVHYKFFSGVEGVEVQYEVTDAPSVPVLFDNFPWLSDEQMTRAIKASVPLFDGSAPERGTILDQLSTALTEQLQARGLTIDVGHELVTLPWNEQRVMRFRGEPGAPVIASVEFTDALAKSDRAIADRMEDLVGKPFSRSAVETFEFEQVRPVYLAHAFLQVDFRSPVTRIESNKVFVSAPIDPGPAFVWSGVTWNGNQAIASSELTKLVEVNLGAPADGMKIQGSWENVRSSYARLGYLDAALDPVPRLNQATKLASYDVKISEGPQYHMGNLVLTGLSIEGEKRVRSAWKIPAGAVFDDSVYEQFLDSGIKQAFVGLPFHYEKIGRFLEKNPADGKINVMIDFQ
ncbi:MAG TPA: POTRA domain-containing protein [Candidatus Cybelea sp.]|nr:POTRA domain-containing protein [Candidatus Cybelea sp.]